MLDALGLFGSVVSGVYANQEQKRNLQRQYDLQLKNWYAQQNYNSPLNQRKRLEEAGINPNVAFSGSQTTSGNASEPAAVPEFSSITPSAAYSQQFLNNTATSIAALAQASKSGAESKQIKTLLSEQVRKMQLENVSTELKNQFQTIENDLQRLFGKRKLSAETERAVVAYYEGLNNLVLQGKQGVSIDLQNMETVMNVLIKDLERHGKGVELAMLKERLKQLPMMLKAELNRTNAEANAANASANASNAQAENIRTDTEFQKKTAEIRNKILENSNTKSVLENGELSGKVLEVLADYDWDIAKIQQSEKVSPVVKNFLGFVRQLCHEATLPVSDVVRSIFKK